MTSRAATAPRRAASPTARAPSPSPRGRPSARRQPARRRLVRPRPRRCSAAGGGLGDRGRRHRRATAARAGQDAIIEPIHQDGLTIGAGVAVKQPRLLVVGLSVVVLTVAVLQTAVVPVLGVIADQLGASMVAVSWAVTANLLAAAAATPLI